MSMELKTIHREVHSKPISAITYNTHKHHVVTGSEDGSIKIWDAETGNQVQLLHKKKEDSNGSSKNGITNTVHQGWVTDLLYWQDARLLLSCSNDGTLLSWGSGTSAPHQEIKLAHPIYCLALNAKRDQIIAGLNGPVKCFNKLEGSSSPMLDEKGDIVNDHTDIVKSVVCFESRVYTASYDRSLIMYESSSYPSDKSLNKHTVVRQAHAAAITCMTVIRDSESNTWWLLTGSFDRCVKVWTQDVQLIHKIEGLGGTVTSICYIPRTRVLWALSGLPVASMFDPKSGENISEYLRTFAVNHHDKHQLVHLHYVPDTKEMYATTNRRTVMVWRYNACAPVSTLQCKMNPEGLAYTGKSPILIFTGDSEGKITKWEQLQLNTFMYSSDTFHLQDATRSLEWSGQDGNSNGETRTRSINKMVFIEELDYLIAASEDSNIYVWGFDEHAMLMLQNEMPAGEEILFGMEEDSVTNRVAGFTCKRALNKHTGSVTGIATVTKVAGQGGMCFY